jgi:hypothetical protein
MKYILLVLTIGVFFLTGCSEDNNTNPQADARIKMYLTDAPAEYDAIYLTITSVEVHRAEGEWFVINGNTQTVDLLELQNGVTMVFADTLLPAGHYTQIRLIISEAEIVVDGITYPLEIPSGSQTGLKLIHEFTLEPDFVYELLLDFDANRSVNQTGNGEYKLKPTIRVVPMTISGILTGTILPPESLPFVWTTQGTDTMSTFAAPDGMFKLIGLPEGLYALRIEPQDTTYRDTVITDIQVTNGQVTNIGTVILTQ